MAPNESCPFDDDIIIYSEPFNISLLDLIVRDETYTHSQTKF